MRLNRLRRDRHAFTLIELLIVVVIIAILLVVAIPGFLSQQTKAKDQKAKQNLAYAFRDIRSNTPETNNLFPAAQSMVSWVQQSEPQLATTTGSCYAPLTANAVVVDSASTSGNLTLCTKSDSGNLWKLTATPTGAPSFVDGSAVPLVLSGNEITDAARATDAQGDGLIADSSTGVWEATSNLVENGGAETNTNGWGCLQNCTLSRDASQAKFGIASVKVSAGGGGSNVFAVVGKADGSRIPVTGGSTYTASTWIRQASGPLNQYRIGIRWYDASGLISESVSGYATTGGGTFAVRPTVSGMAPGTALTAQLEVVYGGNSYVPASGDSFYIDGAQFEQKAFATPYVETNGTAASRSVARIQAPSALINVTQGWFVIRLRVGWPSTADPYSGSSLVAVSWRDDSNNGIDVRYDPTTDTWRTRRSNGSGGTQAASSLQTFTSGAVTTVAGTWTAGAVAISVDGSNFVSVAAPYTPALTSTTFDIGDREDNTSQQIDGSVLWFASGTGTLSDSDAATINGWGNTDPKVSSFPASAGADFVWDGASSSGSLK